MVSICCNWFIKSAQFFRLPAAALAKEGAARSMLARQAVLLTSSESVHPTQLLFRQQSTPVSPFSCNTYGPPRKCCKQKTYGRTKSFRCNRVEKSLHLCLAGLRIRWFDPIAEASELPKHLRSAELLRSFGDRWAPFFVTNSLVQDQPDQPTLSMGDGPNGLIVSQARDRAAIHDLEDASFGSGCGVSSLIE